MGRIMKYNVYTTDANFYLNRGESNFVMHDFCRDGPVPKGWAWVGEVEFTPTAPESHIREAAVKELDREMSQKRADSTYGAEIIANAEAQMKELQRRKEELLAITHQPETGG